MEIYKYLRNECMDIKRSVCAGGAFLCTRRRGSFQLSFFVKERQPLRCNVQPESQNTCFPHNIIKNETGNIERRMHITQNYHKKNILQQEQSHKNLLFQPTRPFPGCDLLFLNLLPYHSPSFLQNMQHYSFAPSRLTFSRCDYI